MSGAPFPTCVVCGHEFHGLPCRTSVSVHRHAKRTRCGCPTSCTATTLAGLAEFGPDSHNPPPEAA